ncbi:MAG: hypothetical protein H0S84_10355 [Bacteroidales bacterium]|jgi:hypothetical protein|nr:hypothetical protein [Bacteroidales bacterium]MDN5349646.1 hypothetical protein [Bacteroidales bacterium]
MKNIITLFFSILLITAVSFSSCKKDDETDPLSCDLETASTSFEEASLNVTYKLEASGDYTISSFFYYDESGKVELQNPEPQEITVSLSNQKNMQAGAVGNVTDGSIKVSYKATTETTIYEGIDQCSQSTN